ncbi:Uncharacterised protein [Mycobacteroides abscessus subsp. abscessus]|nr:Uncharacterised protein [Mycobacteroides abscessus subsp. abscessus]
MPRLSATDRPGRSPMITSRVRTFAAAPTWSPSATRACVAITGGASVYWSPSRATSSASSAGPCLASA